MHVLGQKYGEIFPRHVLGDAVQDQKPRVLSSPEQNNHPDLEGRADGGGRARPSAAICPPFEVRMLASIVVRTKIAKFGPGQFNFVLAKTEIAVFGPEQNHPARGGERFRRIFARARASIQHLPGQEIAIILTGHVLGPLARRQRQPFSY